MTGASSSYGLQVFYVTTSNNVSGYFVADNGELNQMNTEFTGFGSPRPIVP